MPLTGNATPLGIPNFGANDRPDLAGSSGPGLPLVTAGIDTLLANAGLYPVAGVGKRPTCRLYQTAGQGISAGAWTQLVWSGEQLDNANMHAPGASSVTAPLAGAYLLLGRVSFPAGVGTTGLRFMVYNSLGVFQNVLGGLQQQSSTTSNTGADLADAYVLNAGDIVALEVYVGGGLGASVATQTDFTNLQVVYLGAF